ncbi:MAG TPA: dihydropteroate synthase [Sandaracinaceae bacterium]
MAPARDGSRGRRDPLRAPPERCEVWGILNVTPDSFSDGGRYVEPARAVAHAERMVREGADVIDVGGESSRPAGATYGEGAERVPVEEELRRVLPVVRELCARSIRVSIDTVKPEVARAALEAGATIVNDVSCGASDALLDVVAAHGAELVLMHSREGGRVDARTTAYDDVVADVRAELERAVDRAAARGVDRDRIWIDPGIGFAKTPAQSVALLGNLDVLVRTGYRVLVGASRKSFIARTVDPDGAGPGVEARLGGSLAAVTAAVLAGASAVRVHDVFESVQAARVAEAMRRAR